jgi:parallel beta-helix repeat protein
MTRLTIILAVLFSFFLTAPSSTSAVPIGSKKINKIYYVDSENGNNSNNGTNANSAWKTISKVNATNFLAGDYILFKRGGTWYETLQMTSNGTTAKPIVYGAYGEMSQPDPVFDAQLTRNNCVYLYGKNNITVQNIRMQNAAGNGAIRIMYATNVKVQGCSFYVTSHGGVFIENSTNCLITGNNITTPSYDLDKQTDGIYSQRNSGNIYENNHIVITNPNAAGHIDGIQSYIDHNLTIRGNYIFQDNPKTNSQGIYVTTGTGVHTFFNNVVFCPNAVASTMGFKNFTAGTATLRAYHNTLVGKGANILAITGDPAPVVKNNIFVALSPSHGIIRVDSTCINPSNISYNIYKNGGSTISVTYKGQNISFAQWKALGFEPEGMFADPQLESDFKLKPSSPAINKGVEIGSSFAYDKAGVYRPQQLVVDIGAYESFYKAKGDGEENISPLTFELAQNYPNPFNPVTTIRYTLPEASFVSLKIFDVLGNEVAALTEGTQPAGSFETTFDGNGLASGTYIYRLTANSFVETRKMILLK